MRAPTKTIKKARRLRRNLSLPEARLWRCLKARVPGRPVFQRQHPVGPYVIDFYCAKARLAIEVDGLAHDLANRPARDLLRDSQLTARGITVLRIPAADLIKRLDETADAIVRGQRSFRTSPNHRLAAKLTQAAPASLRGHPRS
ncbi:MAG: endonuclease domain-containing protein [Xanthobacteraceae bacterium]